MEGRGEDAQVRDDGALVRRVDGVGRVSGGLVEGVVPLKRSIDDVRTGSTINRFDTCVRRTSAVTVAPAGTSITAWEMGWW